MTTHSDRRSSSWPYRKGSSRAIAFALAALVGGATVAQAAPAPFRDGQLSIQVLDLDPLSIPPSPPLVSGLVNATRVGDTLLSLQVPAGVFDADGLTEAIDPPIGGTIFGVELTAANGSGSFTSGGPGVFGGPMPLDGELTICSIDSGAGCPGLFPVTIPLDVVGVGGVFTEDFILLVVTVEGAPWTLGPVSIPTDTQGGSIEVSGGISPTAGPGSDLAVELVSPIFIETDDPDFAVVPAWATLRLVVPEPGGASLGLGAVGTLLLTGLARRRSPPASEASR